ncbi:MAG: hypothetical protein WBN68_15290, partial [Sedimenticolaceae bacterium]
FFSQMGYFLLLCGQKMLPVTRLHVSQRHRIGRRVAWEDASKNSKENQTALNALRTRQVTWCQGS